MYSTAIQLSKHSPSLAVDIADIPSIPTIPPLLPHPTYLTTLGTRKSALIRGVATLQGLRLEAVHCIG